MLSIFVTAVYLELSDIDVDFAVTKFDVLFSYRPPFFHVFYQGTKTTTWWWCAQQKTSTALALWLHWRSSVVLSLHSATPTWCATTCAPALPPTFTRPACSLQPLLTQKGMVHCYSSELQFWTCFSEKPVIFKKLHKSV